MSRASIPTINPSVLRRAEYNLTQARCRCASSMPIARGCISKNDDLASQCLVDIRTHAGRLYCAISEMVDLEILQSYQETGWRQALHYLFMVQSITGIASDSAFYLGDQTNSCSCLNAYDSLVDEISENYLTASVKFIFIFTALECATKARSSNLVVVGAREARQTTGGLRKMVESRSYNELGHDLDARLTLTESMRSARDVALAACLRIGDMAEDLADLSRNKDGSSSDKDTFFYCLKLLKKFRNRFSHGDEIVSMPDNGEISSGRAGPEITALVDRHNAMSRIALMMMQLCLIIDSKTDFKVRVGTDDDCLETFMMASKVLKHLHHGNYGARSLIERVQGPSVERMPRSIYEERAKRIRAERAAIATAAA